MTQPSHVRVLAQRDPIGPLTTQLGQLVEQARTQTANLTATLKHIDEVRANLRNRENLEVNVDAALGEVGRAAAIARRQVEDGKTTTRFALPRP